MIQVIVLQYHLSFLKEEWPCEHRSWNGTEHGWRK